MSDDLRKRQRIDDREVMRVVDNQENTRSRQVFLEHEIRSLRQEIDSLSIENKSLNSYISRFTSSLATVTLIQHITDLQCLCQAYTVDPLFQPQAGSAFSILARRSTETVPELLQLFKSSMPPLLSALEKFKAGYSAEEINKKCLALQEGYISFSSQLSECKAENHQAKEKIKSLEEELKKKVSEAEGLRRDKEKLVEEKERNTNQPNCKCRCRCGARKPEGDEPADDVKEVKAELSRIKEERMFYVLAAEEKSEKIVKLQMELEVSEERFIKTKAFRSLVSQAREVLKQIESLKKANEDLQKRNEEFNDTKFKEIRSIVMKEDEKRLELENLLKNSSNRIVALEKEKEEVVASLNMMRKEQINMKKSNNFKCIIKDLEEEKSRLKKQVQELMKEKLELVSRIEEEQKKVFDLKDQLLLKEIALQKCVKEEIVLPANESELEYRLKEYKAEINDLKCQIKQKDKNISKQDSMINSLRSDLKSEKRNNENLLTEIEVTGNAYEEALKKCKALCGQLQFSEQNYNQLMNERIKEENWKSILEKKQKTLEETIEAKENVILQLQEMIKEQEKVSAARLDTINALDLKFKTLEQKFSYMNSSQVEANKRIEELVASKKEIQEKLRQAEKFCIKSATDCMQFRFLYENCLKSCKELEETIAVQKDSFIERNMDQGYIAEIAKYRDMLRCSQCRTRNKDCLLTKCLHMYCRKCIELNLSQKKRKCPACYTKFSSDDVRSFYWS